SNRDLDWSTDVDPFDPDVVLFDDQELALGELPIYRALPRRTQLEHCRALLAWMLSQFLHGEQGALSAACQLTEAVSDLDAKLYGSTQVVDERRHVEVFERYLEQQLEKRYPLNDNQFVELDQLERHARWDMEVHGVQTLD